MSKRRRQDTENKKVEDAASTKRTQYELQHGRDYFSLPQYDKPVCQHKYHLRSFEHRKPVNYYSITHSSLTANSFVSLPNRNHTAATNPNSVNDVRRNAHSYSINGHTKRFSNSSSVSSRKRKLEVLKNDTVAAVVKKRKQVSKEQQEDVSCR